MQRIFVCVCFGITLLKSIEIRTHDFEKERQIERKIHTKKASRERRKKEEVVVVVSRIQKGTRNDNDDDDDENEMR